MRRKRRWLRLVYFLLGLVLAYGVGCYYLATKYVRPGVANDGPIPHGFHELTEPDIWASNDFEKSKAVYILVHGYGGNQFGWSDVARGLVNRGHGVLIPALPGHDNRTDETSGFGGKESEEVARLAEWTRSQVRPGTKIVLVGVSMGGAACWLATAKTKEVDAIVTEGCFARLESATQRWFNRKAPGASTVLSPVIWFSKQITGVDPSTINPVEMAAKWKGKPSLVIHGEVDELFQVADAKQLATAAESPIWIVPGAGHAQCSNVDLAQFVKRLSQVIESIHY